MVLQLWCIAAKTFYFCSKGIRLNININDLSDNIMYTGAA